MQVEALLTPQQRSLEERVNGKIAGLERILEDRVDWQTVGGLQKRINRIEGLLQAKADNAQLQTISQSCQGIDAKVANVEQALSGGTDRMRELEQGVRVLNMGIEALEKSVRAKADSSAVDDMKGYLSKSMQAVEQTLQGKVSSAELAEVYKSMQGMEQTARGKVASELAEFKACHARISESKADASRVHWLSQQMCSLQALVSDMEKALSVGTDKMKKSEQTIAWLQQETSKNDLALREKSSTAELLKVKNTIEPLQASISDQSAALKECVRVGEVQQFIASVKICEAHISDVQTALKSKADAAVTQEMGQEFRRVRSFMKDTEATLVMSIDRIEKLQQAIASLGKEVQSDHAAQLTAAAAEINDVKTAVTNLQSKHLILEGTLRKSTVIQDLAELSKMVKDLQAQITHIDGILQGKADNLMVRQLDRDVNDFHKQFRHTMSSVPGKIQELEGTIATLDSKMQTSLDEGRSWCSQFVHDKIVNIQSQMKSTVQNVQAKCNSSDMQHLRSMVENLESVIHNQRSPKDAKQKVHIGHLEALNDEIRELHKNVKNLDSQVNDDVRELHKDVKHLDSQVSSLQHSSNDKASKNDIFQLKQTVISITQAVGMKQAAGSDRHVRSNLDEFGDSPGMIIKKVEAFEGAMRSGTDRLHQLEDIVGSIQTKVDSMQGLAQASQQVSDFQSEIKRLDRLIIGLERASGGKTSALQSGTDRLHQLEEIIGSIRGELDSCRRGSATASHQVSELRNDMNHIDQQVDSLRQANGDKASKVELQQLKLIFQNMKQISSVEREARGASSRLSTESAHDMPVDIVTKRMETLEVALQTGTEQLVQMEETLFGIQTKVNGKVDRLEIQQLNDAILSIQSRATSSERSAHASQSASQVQDLIDQIKRVELDVQQKVKLIEESTKAMESELCSRDQGIACSMDRVKPVEIMMDSLKARLKELEEAVASKAAAADVSQLKGITSSLKAEMSSLGQFTQQDNTSLDSVQQVKGSIINMQAQVNSINQALCDKAPVEHVQKLKATVTGIQANLAGLEQQVNDKAGTEQMHQLNSAITGIQSKMTSVEQHKADSSNFQQLNDSFNTWQTKVPSTERVQQLEATVTSLGQHISRMEQAITQGKALKLASQEAGGLFEAGVHTQVELQHFKGIIAGMEKKVTDLEQDMHSKVSTGQLQQIRRQIMGVDTKIVEVEQLLHEKAAVSQVQQLQGSLQVSISTVEQAVQEKLSVDQLQPIKASLASVQAQTASVEQSLHDKVCINQMQQMKGTIASTQSKVCSLDQAMQDKVGNGQVQQLKDAVASVQGKLTRSVDEAVANQMKQLCQDPYEDGFARRAKRLRGLTND